MNRFYNLMVNSGYLTLPLLVFASVYWNNLPIWNVISIITVAILLMIISKLSIIYANKESERFNLKINNFEDTSSNVLGIFAIFLIPIACKQFNIEPITLGILGAIFLLLFVFINPFVNNPIFSLFGFKIYKITTPEGGTYIFLSKEEIKTNDKIYTVYKISEYVLINQ